MATATAHFSVSGEFMTNHARALWLERRYAKALDVLGCLIGATRDQHEDILFGRARLEGTNDLELVPDNWTPPDGYALSLNDALAAAESLDALEDCREGEAFSLAQLIAKADLSWTHGDDAAERSSRYRRLVRLVGEDRASEMVATATAELDRLIPADAVMSTREIAPSRRPAEIPDARPSLDPLEMLAHHNRIRLELAGLDPAGAPSADALLHRGTNLPTKAAPDMASANGWLDRSGNYYPCGPMEHVGLASNLFPDAPDGEQAAESAGWVKIARHMTGTTFLARKKPTKRQLARLWDYCQKHGHDYEEKIANLPDR